jgi:DNA gyrase subunit A
MEVGLVRSVDIDQEMQQAYLDYAMSVIVARALPDARDGLKPVHRRILYAMYDMGVRPDTPFKKSARIVGEVLGKYHPHGDMAVYDAMARMAQDFSMRCLLIEGQGNFGSVDGDPPAAMRYTEARLANPAMHMLADIRKNTVNFSDNFDGSLSEPDVLPAALPNLLVNGATGIAVGMSTNIPPHNLGEVVDALTYMLANWNRLDDISVEDLMRFIQGPDFPTGGIIIPGEGEEDLKAAYGSGRGRVTVQARAHLEEMSRGRNRIIVTELPYLTNKSALIERIAELARDGKLEGLADLRDESDRQGLRIVIEMTKTAEPEDVLQNLYKHTPMRSTFSIIMLALVDGEPRLLSLKQALRVYLEHRLTVIQRRAEYDLERLRMRAHILEGLRVALKNLDEVIQIIRRAEDADIARDRLMKRFKLSEAQAQAILDMQLRRLAALERKKIEEEYKQVLAEIKDLEALLRSPARMRHVVSEELNQVKEAYTDRRRSLIAAPKPEGKPMMAMLTTSDLVPEKTVWISALSDGTLSRAPEGKQPRLSGTTAPMWSFQASTRHTLYLVTESGEAAAIPILSLPEAESPTEGTPTHRLSPLRESDHLVAMFTLPPKDERPEQGFVVSASRQGMVKKTSITELPGPSAHTFILAKVNEEDALGWVRLTRGEDHILLATADGMAIRFKEEEVRPMGLVAAGVGGIKLGARDMLIGMEVIQEAGELFFITTDGHAKRVAVDQFPIQGRNGMGVLAWKLPRSVMLIGLAAGKPATRLTLHLHRLAPKVIRMDEAPLQGRAAQGKKVLELKPGDEVIALSMPDAQGSAEEPAPPAGGKRKTRRSRSASTPPAEGGTATAKKAEAAHSATQVTFEALLVPEPQPATAKVQARKTQPGASKPAPEKSPLRRKSKPAGEKAEAKKPAGRGKAKTTSKALPAAEKPKQKTASRKEDPSKPQESPKPAGQSPSKRTRKPGAGSD